MPDIQRPSREHFTLLSRVIRDVVRTRRLTAEDARDFAQHVHLKMLERRYDVFERYAGRSSLGTYLTVVVNRIRLDWQRAVLGKWRPSAAAQRLGPVAVALDRLIHRDGLTHGEAVGMLEAGGAADQEQLRELVDQLPRRQRRRVVTDTELDSMPGTTFADPIESRDRLLHKAAIRRALLAALRALPTDDRRLIAARYLQGCSVPTVARAFRADPKIIYRRCDRALKSLRRRLQGAGVHGSAGDTGRPEIERYRA